MARHAPRLTAGVGVLVAFLLLGGPATVATADPGRSHSDRDNSSDRANGHGNGRGGSNRDDDRRSSNGDGRGRSDRVDRRGDGDNRRQRGADHRDGETDSGTVENPFGSGPIDLAGIAELVPSNSGKSDDGNGSANPGIAGSPQARLGSSRLDTADVAEAAPIIAAEPGELRSTDSGVSEVGGFGAAGSPDRSGSDRADVPKARFTPPRLTLGEERTPSTARGEIELRRQAVVPELAPAAPPIAPLAVPVPVVPPPPSSLVNRLPAAPVLTQQPGASQEVDWSDPLWGLTGLLLIPAAGAILGYRQARAAHAADRLRRS